MLKQLTGIHVPLVTPFAEDGTVAVDALRRLAHEVLDAGAAGIVACSTTGEYAALAPDERCAVLDACAEVHRERTRDGRRPPVLTAGAGGNDTRGCLAALRELESRPEVAAALVVVPYFTRPSEEGVFAHFATLAAESPVPLVIYNIPYRTARPLGAATLLRLLALPGVVGVKHAVGAVDPDTVAVLADAPEDVAVLAGDDVVASPLLALGASGGILASAHVSTEKFVMLVDLWRRGEVGRARRLGHELQAVSAALFAEPNPAVIKGVLHAQGRIPTADVRLPLLPAAMITVRNALEVLSVPAAGGRRIAV